jgi:hypothetical protein
MTHAEQLTYHEHMSQIDDNIHLTRTKDEAPYRLIKAISLALKSKWSINLREGRPITDVRLLSLMAITDPPHGFRGLKSAYLECVNVEMHLRRNYVSSNDSDYESACFI